MRRLAGHNLRARGAILPGHGLTATPAAPQIITATSAPVLASLTDGGTLSDAVTWGTYASSAGTIATPTTKEMSVNGAAFAAYDGATVVSEPDTYRLRETVADDAGTTPRSFLTSTQTVAASGATLTVATTGGAGEIIFDPIAPLDQWTATTGDAGEIIFEEAA